jgi:hypothetical protein
MPGCRQVSAAAPLARAFAPCYALCYAIGYFPMHVFPPAMRRFLSLFFLLPLLTMLLALPPSPAEAAPAPSLRFKKLGPLGGDEPSMLSLLQDKKGFVWVGTHTNGLYRYNGYQAVKYINNPNDAHSLPHDRVSAIYEDRQGRIWAGTQNGLARFNPESNNFTAVRASCPGAEEPPHRQEHHFRRQERHVGRQLGRPAALRSEQRQVHRRLRARRRQRRQPGQQRPERAGARRQGRRVGRHLARRPRLPGAGASVFKHHQVDPAPKPDARVNIVRALQFDNAGALWIGTESGVIRWDGKSDWDTRKAIASPYSRITNFNIDNKGVLWGTTLSAGLLRWNEANGEFDQFVHAADDPYSLPGDNLRAVMQDRGGMLWIASFTDGISLANLSSEGFTRHVPFRIDSRSAPASNALLSLARAPGSRIWLGGNVGMSLYDPATSTVVKRYLADDKKPGMLSHSIVYSMYQDDDGKGPLWLGTSNGLNRLDTPDSPFQVIHFGNTASDYINAIAPGAGGVLWLATGNSLIRYEPKSDARKIYYNDAQDPTSRSVNGTSAVLEDRAGRVWAGSEWNGAASTCSTRRPASSATSATPAPTRPA